MHFQLFFLSKSKNLIDVAIAGLRNSKEIQSAIFILLRLNNKIKALFEKMSL